MPIETEGIAACMRLNAKLHAELEAARMDIGVLLGEIVAHQANTETSLDSDDAAIVEAIRERWEPKTCRPMPSARMC